MKNIFIVTLFGLSLALNSCSQEKQATQEVEDIRSAFLLQKQEVENTLKLPGELVAYEKAEITAKIDSYVQRVLVDIGDKVKKGQVLAILEAPEMEAKFAESNAKFQEAGSRYNASKDRYQRILKASQQMGAISESELINNKNQMAADSAAWNAAKLTAQNFGYLRDYLTLRAPFDGVVTQRNIDPGNFVSPSTAAVMLMVEKADKLRLRIFIPETYVYSIPDENGVSFTTEAVSNKTFTANLARRSGSINSDTRTELWEYEFENKQGALKPGMYTNVSLNLSRAEASFVVPNAAVATTLEKKFVVRIKDGIAEWIDVRTGISKDGKIEVFGNLEVGDTLLSRASDELKPGTNVKTKIE